MQFKDLNIIPEIQKALDRQKYITPTEIQERAIPSVLLGKDILGCAQTGTGKTAAFAVPTLQLLYSRRIANSQPRKIRALILTPTRELAVQIYDSFNSYGRYTNLRSAVVYGGVSQRVQEKVLKNGVDILVATPGRLNDLINQNIISLQNIEILILDEADHMLDMGFIHDVKRIISHTPPKKQILLFSATMPPEISSLANALLFEPVKIAIKELSSAVDTVKQSVYFVDKGNKLPLLLDIMKDKNLDSVLIFTRTKHGADRLAKELSKVNISVQAIHGDKSQAGRQLALNNFKRKTTRVLVATDIAARGIDISELSCVINYDLPNIPETYVHRIGRTGRAGLSGIAISFCDFEEKAYLRDIEKLIKTKVPEVKDHDFPMLIMKVPPKRNSNRNNRPSSSGGQGGGFGDRKRSYGGDRRQRTSSFSKDDAPRGERGKFAGEKSASANRPNKFNKFESSKGEFSKDDASRGERGKYRDGKSASANKSNKYYKSDSTKGIASSERKERDKFEGAKKPKPAVKSGATGKSNPAKNNVEKPKSSKPYFRKG